MNLYTNCIFIGTDTQKDGTESSTYLLFFLLFHKWMVVMNVCSAAPLLTFVILPLIVSAGGS